MFHAGEALIQSLKRKGQAAVICPEKMEHGGMKVSHINGVFYHVVTEIIGLSVVHPTFDTASRKPSGEASGVVVAPVIVAGNIALAKDGSPKLSGKDY